ncbi:MAG: hypothetical protein OXH70_02035 [Acidobacteria bacterium]|nr:hypothetical protein [Acidobacteriota bacterium]MCY3971591.1 hypothetical protein [Acidobacteriota bacterium]
MTNRPRLRRAVAALLPFLVVLAALPASGLLGSLSGVASEITQILNVAENALSAVETAATAAEAANTVLELKDQIQQDLDQAMGRVGALVERFEDLSTDPVHLLEDATGVAWAGDFNGPPLQVLNAMANMQDDTANSLLTHFRQELATADTVSRQRYTRTFRDVPSASNNWLAQRQRSDRALVADYLVLDSAERVVELIGNASASVERSRQQTNLSETALAQEQHANALTKTEIEMAVAQLLAHNAARDMLAQAAQVREHREELEAWIATERAERRRADRAQNRVRGQGYAWSRAFRLN